MYACLFAWTDHLVSLDTKFKTLAMNSHNKDRDYSWTCLFNSYSDGGHHISLQQARVTVNANYILAVL